MRRKLLNFVYLIFLLTVFLSGMILQQEFMHQSISQEMGCSTVMYFTPDLGKGFLMAVETSCIGLSESELLELRTRHALVDSVFYMGNLLALPLVLVLFFVSRGEKTKTFI